MLNKKLSTNQKPAAMASLCGAKILPPPLPSPTHPSYPQPDYPADFLGLPQAMTLLVLSNKLRTGQNPIQLSHLSVVSRSL